MNSNKPSSSGTNNSKRKRKRPNCWQRNIKKAREAGTTGEHDYALKVAWFKKLDALLKKPVKDQEAKERAERKRDELITKIVALPTKADRVWIPNLTLDERMDDLILYKVLGHEQDIVGPTLRNKIN